MSNKQNDTLLEQLIADNEGKLQDIHAKNYIGTDDDMSDAFDNWLSDLSLEEVCEMLNVNIDNVDNGQQHYEDMQSQYE